jgi:hypothetical protein
LSSVEEPTPAYSLEAIQIAVAEGRYWRTGHAENGWGESGRTEAEFKQAIARLRPEHLLASVPSERAEFKEFIDVYGYAFNAKKGFWFRLVFPEGAEKVKVISSHHTDWPPNLLTRT